MSRVKYYYDKETATYKKVEKSFWTTFTLSLIIILFGSALGVAAYLQNSELIQSPKEIMLKRELENMKFSYQELNKKMDNAFKVLEDLENRDNSIYRTYFEAKPIHEDVRKAGFGGVNRYSNMDGFDNSEMIKKTAKKIDVLSKELVIHSKSLDEVIELAKNKEKMLASIPAINPISKKNLNRIASGFGYRLHPILKIYRLHSGIDLSAPRGTPIYASGNGRITKAERSGSYGNFVTINHGYGYESNYAHMSNYIVHLGQKVKRGDIIGYVGNTGLSSASHLHYEVIKNGHKINPIGYFYKDISPDEYKEWIDLSNQTNQSLD